MTDKQWPTSIVTTPMIHMHATMILNFQWHHYSTDIDNCISSILSSDQVEDIQFQQSGLLYIIINGQLVISRRPLDLYIKLSRIVSRMVGITSMIDVWFSHTPCAHCIDYLDMLFGSFTVKPILHVESLRYNGSNYDIIRDLGCLAKLSTKEFHLKPWDWSIFSAKYGLSCDYYSTAKHSTEYKTQKNYTETLLVFLEKNFTRSALVDLCE